MTQWRKTLAGGLAMAVCVCLGVTAEASNGRGRGDRRSVVTGQDAPVYQGRKAGDHPKLDGKLNDRARIGGLGRTRAIIVLKPGCSVDGELSRVGGRKGQRLGVISGQVVELPNGVLRRLADNPCVASIHWDRKLGGEMNRAAVTLGARAVQQQLGFDGAGVGVAIIDSGITGWHDDLTYHGSNSLVQVVGNQRVTKFVDFVNGQTAKYDDNGHGSHVAGIIAGNGWDTLGARAGIAPAADLVSLKVLDSQGGGYISNVIAALDWVVANRTLYNIRVVNLSVGAAVTESYTTDPLTVAAKRVVDTGVVVVAAAGNLGTRNGHTLFGGITAPGNAPWVLTVGADSHQGTVTRTDDIMTTYSSRGPTAVDYDAKPDVVAPGTGIVSLSVPGSVLYALHPANLLSGSLLLGSKPYLSLTGTSMSAPMVTGTVALMMQANPSLTPNLAKAIIEYTAQDYGYSKLSQGAGFLNTEGAVRLARYLYTAQPGSVYPSDPAWSRTLIWGNRVVTSGVIKPQGNAYALNIVWGTAFDQDANGDQKNIVWGTHCPDAACQPVWGSALMDGSGGSGDPNNIVWGSFTAEGDEIVWGTNGAGTVAQTNIVWGTACDEQECDNIVWGQECDGADCDNTDWGTACPADAPTACNIVWGSADNGTSGDWDNIVWGSNDQQNLSNVIWGQDYSGTCAANDPSCENNIVWGSDYTTGGGNDNIVWGTSEANAPPVFDDPDAPTSFDDVPFWTLFVPVTQQTLTPPVVPPPPSGTTPGGGLL